MTDTNELRKLLEKATPRPWIVQNRDGWDSWLVTGPAHEIAPGWTRNAPDAFDDGSACGEYGPSCTEATRDLIVAAVNGLPALLDELDDLRARVEVLERVREAAARVAVTKAVYVRTSKHLGSGVHGQSLAATAAYNRAEEARREARVDLETAETELRAALDAAKETP